MTTCFVIQPFDDGGKFDKRYEDILAPAVTAAGFESYRVDRDPKVTIPIKDIEKGIESSAICLADISTDNPNVWFELGYALAAKKEVVIVCSDERTTPFPFDVQHRSIIKYSTDSSQDFDKLRADIESKLKAVFQRRQKLGNLVQLQPSTKFQGLEPHDIAALIVVAESIDESAVATWGVRNAMERSGYTAIACTLALSTLINEAMIYSSVEVDEHEGEFKAYRVSSDGIKWLMENKHMLTLKQDPPPPPDDDIPF